MSSSVQLATLGPCWILDTSGSAISGRPVNIYQRGTTTQVQVWQDAALSVPQTQPIPTDPFGRVPGYIASGQSPDLFDTVLLTRIGLEAVSGQDVAGLAPQTRTLNPQSGTTYTLALSDAYKLIVFSNAGAVTLTIPKNATVGFPLGTSIKLYCTGAGGVTFALDTGVVLPPAGFASQVGVEIQKVATDTWALFGLSGSAPSPLTPPVVT